MRDAVKIFGRYLPPYKSLIVLNILFNLSSALFSLVSVLMLIPVLEILFKLNPEKVYILREISFREMGFRDIREAIINNVFAQVQHWTGEMGAFKVLIAVGVIFIILVLLKTTFIYLASLSMVFIRNYVVRDIRDQMYRKIIHLPIGFFTEERKGDIIARVTGDVTEVENSVMTSLDLFFRNPILILTTIILMFIISWQLSLFILVLFPLAGGLLAAIGKQLRRASFMAQTKMGEILSTIEESLGGLRIIKAFNAEERMFRIQNKQNQQYRRIMNGVQGRHQMAVPLSEFIGTLVIVIVMMFGGRLILMNSSSMLEPSLFISYIALFFTIIQPSKAFAGAFYKIQKGLAAMNRIDEILDTKNPIVNPASPKSISDLKQGIEFRNVSFRYSEEFVLKDINLTIPRGRTIALVGQSGSGKSTLVDLLPRFYDVVKGEILIDGTDIRKLDLFQLRNLFGFVNQDPILFNDTIFNNIAFGNSKATEREVSQAARIANAHEFIRATEDGYQTGIGDRGTRLSGGQRQRLSIARAILKNPAILILDEATSSLDTESERLVQEAIDNLMKDRTSIIIAHRLSTIRNVDEIYVLHEGRIIEQGSYNELLKLGGEFRKLHDNQFS